jgi:hypothetical protein
MEFEYSGTIYFDTDAIFERCCDLNYIDAEDIYTVVQKYISELGDTTYFCVEGWMIDEVVAEVKKRIDKCLED